jgi:hypothetical protein
MVQIEELRQKLSQVNQMIRGREAPPDEEKATE